MSNVRFVAFDTGRRHCDPFDSLKTPKYFPWRRTSPVGETMSLYMTDAERVWNRLKTAAGDAAQKRTHIADGTANMIVDTIIADERAQSIPPEARAFFARELQELARHARL